MAHMLSNGTASDICEALLRQALAHVVDIQAQFARGQALALFLLPGFALLGFFQCLGGVGAWYHTNTIVTMPLI